MKKVLIALLLACCSSYAQNRPADSTATKRASRQEITEYISFRYMLPTAIGNNMLAKAHDPLAGAGLDVTFVSYKGFHFMGGASFANYRITDYSLAPATAFTRVYQIYGKVLYKIPVSQKVAINPAFSLGRVTVAHGELGRSFGRQHGTAMGFGVNADYQLFRRLRVFAGAEYTAGFLTVRANEEVKDFYSRIGQLAFFAGIKL